MVSRTISYQHSAHLIYLLLRNTKASLDLFHYESPCSRIESNRKINKQNQHQKHCCHVNIRIKLSTLVATTLPKYVVIQPGNKLKKVNI